MTQVSLPHSPIFTPPPSPEEPPLPATSSKPGPYSSSASKGALDPIAPQTTNPIPSTLSSSRTLFPPETHKDVAPLFHGGSGSQPLDSAAENGKQEIPDDPMNGIDPAHDQDFFEEHSRFLNELVLSELDGPSTVLAISEPDGGVLDESHSHANRNGHPDSDLSNDSDDAPQDRDVAQDQDSGSNLGSSYHIAALPAAPGQTYQHQDTQPDILPLYTSSRSPSTASLSASDILVLRPQGFMAFFYEYRSSFFNYVFNVEGEWRGRGRGIGGARTRLARRGDVRGREVESVEQRGIGEGSEVNRPRGPGVR